jgi:replicative DNA helicase
MTGHDDTRIRAEQALLGAVLSDPASCGQVLGYVEASDFHRPWHAQVHAAMQRIQARGDLPGPHQVRAELRTDPDIPEHVHGQAWLITDLMHACPRPSNATAYAGMVAESGTRTRLGQAGARMHQAAGRSDLAAALVQTARARAELETSRQRWAALPTEARTEIRCPSRDERDATQIARQAKAVRDDIGRLRETLWAETTPGLEERLSQIAGQLAELAASQADRRERQATRQAAADARPATPEGERLSRQCLRDLAASPETIDQVSGWLRPGHFATADHGDTYAVLRDMRAAGKPVDAVTASREASRRGVQADLNADTPAPAHPAATARLLHRHATTARAAQAGHDIQTHASDDTQPLTWVFRATDRSLRHVEGEAQIVRQHEPRPPRQPTPPPAARRRTPQRRPAAVGEPAEVTR